MPVVVYAIHYKLSYVSWWNVNLKVIGDIICSGKNDRVSHGREVEQFVISPFLNISNDTHDVSQTNRIISVHFLRQTILPGHVFNIFMFVYGSFPKNHVTSSDCINLVYGCICYDYHGYFGFKFDFFYYSFLVDLCVELYESIAQNCLD